MEFASSYDYESAVRFPLSPGNHDTAWRYLFDWTIAGQALNCAPGDRVLEFAAGTGFVSELLNRLGYQTVALDIRPDILACAHDRLTLDQRLQAHWASFVVGDGQRLPFPDATFDGVICMNAFHHMPDYRAALAEICRVLKAGGRAVFSEPGSQHAEAPESKMVVEQFGEVEKNVVLEEIFSLAREVGFASMLVKPFVYPDAVELDYRALDTYRAFRLPSTPGTLSPAQDFAHRLSYAARQAWQLFRDTISPPPPPPPMWELPHFVQPRNIVDCMERNHSIFILAAPGQRPLTSIHPGQLQAQGRFRKNMPPVLSRQHEIIAYLSVQNTGDTLWLSQKRELGGYITLGVKLCLANGRLLTDNLNRLLFAQDVTPGETVEIDVPFRLPDDLEPGEYLLRFDMVDERIAWFEQRGSPVLEHQFVLTA